MKKITNKNKRIMMIIGGIVAVGVLFAIAIGVKTGTSSLSYNKRLETKISDYSKMYGITIEDIKNDKNLMEELEMEVRQEEKIDKITKDITVSDEDVENYKKMIGNSLDVKKAVFILFNTEDECKAYIEKTGNKPDLTNVGSGVMPLTEKDEDGEYFNVVGNEIIEAVFDSLKDGEYSKEPVEFSGMYAYVKRMGVKSPVSSEKKIKELIKSEKAQEIMQKDTQNGGK